MNESLPLLDANTHRIKTSAVHWLLSSSQVGAQVPCLSTSYPTGSLVRHRSDGKWLLRLGHTRLCILYLALSLQLHVTDPREEALRAPDNYQQPVSEVWKCTLQL